MLRFNPNGFYIETHQTRFQYILCYGSTLFISPETQGLIEFQYILCYGSTNAVFGRRIYRCNISIHLMLRFNEFATFGKKIDDKFQYILCYGSTMSLLFLMKHSEHFNTSYVTVQQEKTINIAYVIKHFNTSYVTVQPNSVTTTISLSLNFNTSYVTVQRNSHFTKVFLISISIHLMLRFNSCTYAFYISHHIK